MKLFNWVLISHSLVNCRRIENFVRIAFILELIRLAPSEENFPRQGYLHVQVWIKETSSQKLQKPTPMEFRGRLNFNHNHAVTPFPYLEILPSKIDGVKSLACFTNFPTKNSSEQENNAVNIGSTTLTLLKNSNTNL